MAIVARPINVAWLEGKVFDLGLVVGTSLAAALVAGVAGLDSLYLEFLVMADLWLLGYHHVIATFTKLAGTAEDRRRNAALMYLLLPGVLATTFLIAWQFGVVAIVTIYFFWQWFHYVRQSWGIAQRYRFRAGGMPWDSLRLSEAAFWSIPVWGVLHRAHQHPDTFLWMPVWMPPTPLWLVQVAGVASIGLVGWWLVSRCLAWQRGELAIGHTLYTASHFAMFACAYMLIDDITVGWLMVNVWHNAQYLSFVWMHNRQRFTGDAVSRGSVMAWLSQPGPVRATAYFGACLLVTTMVYRAIMVGADLMGNELQFVGNDAGTHAIALVILFSMAINFHHYVVDSIIWKRKREFSR